MRFLDFELNGKKKVLYTLQAVYGIGESLSYDICAKWHINPNLKWDYLDSKTKQTVLYDIEKNFIIGKYKKLEQKKHIMKYMKNSSIRGMRLKLGLPVRGQRTKTNAQTAKKIRI